MNSGTKSSNRELLRYWQQFSETIRLFAEKRNQRSEIRQEDYEQVHAGLIQSILDATESGSDQHQLHLAMKELAEPWVNVAALQEADARLLKDLAERCDSLNQQLSKKSPAMLSSGVSLAILLGVFLAAFVLVLGIDVWSGLYDRFFDGSGAMVADWLDALERNRNHARSWLIGIVLALSTAATAWFVFRAPRTY